MRKKTPNWALWRGAFVGMLVPALLNQGKAIDEAHAHAGLIFRVVLCVVGVIGIAVTTHLEQRALRAAKEEAKTTPPSGEGSVSVACSNGFEDDWWCERYLLTHNPFVITVLTVFGLMVAFLAADRIYQFNRVLAYATFPLLWIAGAAAWAAFFALLTRAQLRQRHPSPQSVRVCTTALTPEGVEDRTPDKITFLEWKGICSILEVDGNVLFLKRVAACYIPAAAFPTRGAAKRFHGAAVSLWKSNGADWPAVAAEMRDQTHLVVNAPAGLANST